MTKADNAEHGQSVRNDVDKEDAFRLAVLCPQETLKCAEKVQLIPVSTDDRTFEMEGDGDGDGDDSGCSGDGSLTSNIKSLQGVRLTFNGIPLSFPANSPNFK